MSELLGLQPGDIFARDFRVVRRLTTGGMGALFVVHQLSTNKERVLKLLLASLVNHEDSRIRFMREARAASAIESDHVVDVLTAGIDELTNAPYIVMELLDGQDLGELIEKDGLLSMADVRIIMSQVGHALSRAHDKGIIHRDLKPENIFLANSKRTDEKFCAKVLDFGVAKILSEARPNVGTQPVGSPLFMAPEQTDPYGAIGPQTDVWALGLLAFYLLTGRYYWLGATGNASLPALVREVCFDDIVPPSIRSAFLGVPFLPRAFDAWFFRCVDRNVEARYADAGAAVRAFLDDIVDDHPLRLSARPPPASDRPIGLDSMRSFERISVKMGDLSASGLPLGLGPSGSSSMFDSEPAGRRSESFRGMSISSSPPTLASQAGPQEFLGLGPSVFDSKGADNPLASEVPPTLGAARPPSDPGVPPSVARIEPPVASAIRPSLGRRLLRRAAPIVAGLTLGASLGLLLAKLAKREKHAVEATASSSEAPAFPTFTLPPEPCPRGMALIEPARLLRPFCIDKTEVSVAEWSRCLVDGVCSPLSEELFLGTARESLFELKRSLCNAPFELQHHPMNCIDFRSAEALCAYRGARLPSELEWRAAAHVSALGGLPWGDGPETPLHSNLCRAECVDWGDDNGLFIATRLDDVDSYYGTMPSGSMPQGASPEGVLDLAGNVAEWVVDETVAGRLALGSSFSASTPSTGRETMVLPAGLGSPEVGLRCVIEPR